MDDLQQRDHASFADALPGQAQHQRIELGAAQCQRATDILCPFRAQAVPSGIRTAIEVTFGRRARANGAASA